MLGAIKNKYVSNRIKSVKSEQSRNLSHSPECLNKLLQKKGGGLETLILMSNGNALN